MAVLKFCPICKETKEVTKKGFNKENQQFWFCKTCKKKFIESITNPAKVTKPKQPKSSINTEIIVNNNVIKTVEGSISLDEAFNLVTSYFKEIIKEHSTIKETDSKKTISFTVKTGNKG